MKKKTGGRESRADRICPQREHATSWRAWTAAPTGNRLVGPDNGGRDSELWPGTPFTEIHTLKGHTNKVHSVAFSPDGKRMVSQRGDDRTVRVRDAATGQETLTLKGHTNWVTSAWPSVPTANAWPRRAG